MKTRYTISHHAPRLGWLIKWFFPIFDFKKIRGFAFGSTIYTRFDVATNPDILVHERIHLEQMRFSKLRGVIHFLRFYRSEDYRFKSEMEAYQAQMRYYITMFGWTKNEVREKMIPATVKQLVESKLFPSMNKHQIRKALNDRL